MMRGGSGFEEEGKGGQTRKRGNAIEVVCGERIWDGWMERWCYWRCGNDALGEMG